MATEPNSALQSPSSPSRINVPTVRATRTRSSVGPPPDPALPGSRPTETLMSRERLSKSLYGSLGKPGRGIWHDLQAVSRFSEAQSEAPSAGASDAVCSHLPLADSTDTVILAHSATACVLESRLLSVHRTTCRIGPMPITTGSSRRPPTYSSQTSWSVLACLLLNNAVSKS